MFVSHVRNLWGAVALIGLAAAAHQGWSCNLFTTTSDMFPRRAVGSVVGIGGMAGALGGATLAVAIGYILESTGKNYSLIFFIAGVAYLFALVVIHLLVPKLDQVEEMESAEKFAIGTFIGFGFMGLILGSFVGWCVGLITRQAGVGLLKYMMFGGIISIFVGMLAGLVLTKQHSGSEPA